MKIGITLGATLNLDNYNSGRATVHFEDEYSEKEIQLAMIEGDVADRYKIASGVANDIYTFVENQLTEKIERFIKTLMDEGYV